MKDKAIIVRILKLFKKDLYRFWVVIIGLTVTIGLMTYVPRINELLIDEGFTKLNYSIIVKYSLIIFFIQQLNLLIKYYVEKIRFKFVYIIKNKLQELAFLHFHKIKYEYYDSVSKMDLLSKIDTDISAISSLFTNGFYNIINSILMIIGGVIGVIIINYKLLVLLLISIPIKYIIVDIFSKQQKKNRIDLLTKTSRFAAWMEEILSGIKELRVFGVSTKIKDDNRKIAEDKINAENKVEMLNVKKQIVDNEFNHILNVCIYLIGGYFTVINKLTLGELLAFVSYTSYIITPINSLIGTKIVFSNIMPSVKRFFEFMDVEEETQGEYICESNKYDIAMKNIEFQYQANNENKVVLHNLTIDIPGQSKIAVLGANGSGKSTLIDVLLGLYKVKKGSVSYNSKNISTISLNSYRGQFSYVSQYFYLFNNSIRYNISLNVCISDSKMQEIINDVGLSDLVSEKGLDFYIGVNGAYLSGGQRQKLALARALAHSRNIIILDEITSNTDENFDNNFQKIIEKYFVDKTLILVTHNKKFAEYMDHYIQIEKGNITYDSQGQFIVQK